MDVDVVPVDICRPSPPPHASPGCQPEWWHGRSPASAGELLARALRDERRRSAELFAARAELDALEMGLRARLLLARRRYFGQNAFLLWLEDAPEKAALLLRINHEASGACGHLELMDADLRQAFNDFSQTYRNGVLVDADSGIDVPAAVNLERIGDFLASILDTAFLTYNDLSGECAVRLPALGQAAHNEDLGQGHVPSTPHAPMAAKPSAWRRPGPRIPDCSSGKLPPRAWRSHGAGPAGFLLSGSGPLPPGPKRHRSVGGAASLRAHVLEARLQHLLAAGTDGPWQPLAQRMSALAAGRRDPGACLAAPKVEAACSRSGGDGRCSPREGRPAWNPTGRLAASGWIAPALPLHPQPHRPRRPSRPTSAARRLSHGVSSIFSTLGGKPCTGAGGSTSSTGVSSAVSPVVSISPGNILTEAGGELDDSFSTAEKLDPGPGEAVYVESVGKCSFQGRGSGPPVLY